MEFWVQFWPQLAATVIGVFLGGWVALYLNRYQEKLLQKEKMRKMLVPLRRELKLNQDTLSQIRTGDFDFRESPNLRNATWKAFSAGGELEWIMDPDLLEVIAIAYHEVDRIIKVIEHHVKHLSYEGSDEQEVAWKAKSQSYLAPYLHFVEEELNTVIEFIDEEND